MLRGITQSCGKSRLYCLLLLLIVPFSRSAISKSQVVGRRSLLPYRIAPSASMWVARYLYVPPKVIVQTNWPLEIPHLILAPSGPPQTLLKLISKIDPPFHPKPSFHLLYLASWTAIRNNAKKCKKNHFVNASLVKCDSSSAKQKQNTCKSLNVWHFYHWKLIHDFMIC